MARPASAGASTQTAIRKAAKAHGSHGIAAPSHACEDIAERVVQMISARSCAVRRDSAGYGVTNPLEAGRAACAFDRSCRQQAFEGRFEIGIDPGAVSYT